MNLGLFSPCRQTHVDVDHPITYRIAVGPQAGRKVLTLQIPLPGYAEPFDDGVAKAAGFSLHATVAARAQHQKPERLCRYVSRPAVSEKRLPPLTGTSSVHFP